MHPFANFMAFQAGWFTCVLGAANGHPWLGVVATLIVVALHLQAVAAPAREAVLISVAMLLGLALDSAIVAAGWLTYPNGQFASGLAPYWILCMWALFATTLNVTMRWMRDRYVLAAVFGAIGGPLSYLAGERLGAVEFAGGAVPVVALAIAWLLAMPALVYLAGRIDGTRAQRVDELISRWAAQ